jgi:hypothetical protein
MAEGLALLRAPFPAHQISKLPKPTKKQTEELKADFKKGQRCGLCGGWHQSDVVHLDYVGHAALTDRLLDADPAWTWEPLAMGDGLPIMDNMGGMWIKLTVCGVTRLGYGHAGSKEGGDAIKEVIGDALRNAAMRFGAALELWHKGDLHKDEDEPKSLGSAQNGTDANRQALGGLQPEEQDALRRAVPAIVAAAKDTPSQAKFLAESAAEELSNANNDPNIIRMALWALLDSKTRSAIRAAK